MGKKKFVNQDYSRNKQGENVKEGTRRSRAANIASGTFFGFSIIASMGMVALAVVFFFSRVEGPSMMSTLNAQFHTVPGGLNTDSVLVNRFATPERGDVIVTRFHNANGPNVASDGRRFTLYIKRVIGLEGEHIYFRRVRMPQQIGGHWYRYDIYINGERLDESEYLDPYWGQNLVYYNVWRQQQRIITGLLTPFLQMTDRGYEIFIPPGHIFYIGDNRGGSGPGPVSDDSTRFGPQPMEYIIGVVSDIAHDQSFFQYFWGVIWHAVSFRWLWGG